jgi:AcrR family transcriptional regulator
MDKFEVSGEAAVKSGRSLRKRNAILDAATSVFLRDGYLGASMDEIAKLSSVSKQTVYKHFTSKEALYIEIVSGMTNRTGDAVRDELPPYNGKDNLAEYLENYAFQQLSIVLTPRVMQLRRVVIGEVSRFPELAKVLYERGPVRAKKVLAEMFEQFAQRGLLSINDADMAATHFNWLVMSEPLNLAMLVGDDAIPKSSELRRFAKEGVRVFMAAYGKH